MGWAWKGKGVERGPCAKLAHLPTLGAGTVRIVLAPHLSADLAHTMGVMLSAHFSAVWANTVRIVLPSHSAAHRTGTMRVVFSAELHLGRVIRHMRKSLLNVMLPNPSDICEALS